MLRLLIVTAVLTPFAVGVAAMRRATIATTATGIRTRLKESRKDRETIRIHRTTLAKVRHYIRNFAQLPRRLWAKFNGARNFMWAVSQGVVHFTHCGIIHVHV